MANVTFSKLGLKKKEEIQKIKINDQEVEVKQYLPIQNKLEVIYNAIAAAEDENQFFNPIKLECYCTLEIIFAYTNIKFTDKQKEDAGQLFDLMEENGVIDLIFSTIPEEETEFIMSSCEEAAKAIYNYHNSALGVLENIKQNADLLQIDSEKLISTLNNPEALTLVKNLYLKEA